GVADYGGIDSSTEQHDLAMGGAVSHARADPRGGGVRRSALGPVSTVPGPRIGEVAAVGSAPEQHHLAAGGVVSQPNLAAGVRVVQSVPSQVQVSRRNPRRLTPPNNTTSLRAAS